MDVAFNKKKILSWIVILCMMIPMLVPVLAYAQTSEGVISVNEQEFSLSVPPEINELGLMVSAKDISSAFSLEYAFDSENKAFEIYDDKHGTIILMHNATTFYSGENIYECNPYFYVKNGEPFVEVGFFCNMFASSYDYNKEENKIVIYKDKISDNVAKLDFNGVVTPLYLEPVRTECGLNARVEDLSNCFDIKYNYNESTKTVVLTNEKGEEIELVDGANTFKSIYGEFECGAFFNVINSVPMIEVGFFCDLYGASYEYNDETKTLTIFENTTMEEKISNESMELLGYDSSVSGHIKYPVGAPKGGLDVKLVLQQTGSRYVMYQGYKYYTGNNYILGTVNFEEGETSNYYSFDVSDYYTSTYTTYSLYYEETEYEEYGYCNRYGATTAISYSPLNSSTYNYSAKQFSYSNNPTVDFVVGSNYISGNVELEDGQAAPDGGIDVDLILQTRSRTYTNIYGKGSYYDIGNNNYIGTVTIPSGNNSSTYKFDISDYFTDASTYCYYSLFYSAEDNECVVPYGYYNTYGTITTTDYIPSSGSCYYTTAKVFDFMSCKEVDLTLPIQDGYVPDVEMVETPEANIESGHIDEGERVRLSTSTDGADIYYTTDGSIPTVYSKKYTGSILIESDTVIKAFAVKEDMRDSDVATYTYLVDNEEDVFKFVVGDTNALINGRIVAMDVAPVIINGDIYVPIRVLGESVNACVEWNGDLQQVTYTIGDKSITFTVGDGDCYIVDARTVVCVKTVFEELLSEKYILEYTPISVSVREDEIDESLPTVEVESVVGRSGEEVTVDVSITNNVGIAGFALEVKYDNTILTPVSAVKGDVLTGSVLSNIDQGGDMSQYTSVYTQWSNPSNVMDDGVLYTLTFKINEDAEEGIIPLTLNYIEDDIANQKYETVLINAKNGQIEVVNVIKGDIFSDDSVNSKDAIKLSQHLARWSITLTEREKKAADVFSDNSINSKDAIKLSQYLARWNITLD